MSVTLFRQVCRLWVYGPLGKGVPTAFLPAPFGFPVCTSSSSWKCAGTTPSLLPHIPYMEWPGVTLSSGSSSGFCDASVAILCPSYWSVGDGSSATVPGLTGLYSTSYA